MLKENVNVRMLKENKQTKTPQQTNTYTIISVVIISINVDLSSFLLILVLLQHNTSDFSGPLPKFTSTSSHQLFGFKSKVSIADRSIDTLDQNK